LRNLPNTDILCQDEKVFTRQNGLGIRLAIKQAGLTACLACLIGNQASQQAEGPDLGKPASQRRACLLACLPA